MTLHLTLKKKWFDMTRESIKLEEYREITPYWAVRLLYRIVPTWGGYMSAFKDIIIDGDYDCKGWKSFTGGAPVFREFTYAQIRHGYASDAPTILRAIESISIGEGRPEWGAEPGKKYFVIRYK